ncbi:MAG: tetratricopeptide repeat protein [Ignavibacteriae bacterium]|nr:tetratricopeptide repeat protein [Ignavibacteriota bacterium]
MRNFFLALVLCAFVAPAPAQNTKENADFKLAINLYNDKLYDLAQEQLKQFVAAYPTTSQSVEARFYLGLTQLQLKEYEDASITFQTFALTYQDNPRAPEAWWNVGEAHAALGSLKEAALAFERVKVFHPRSKNAPDALLRAAKLFTQTGERDNARRTLRVILQEYPTSGAVNSARTLLGQIYFEEGNLDLASNELKRVIEGDPSADARAQALLILANIHQEMGRFDQAKSAYQEIITAYKTPSAVQGAHLHLARLLTASGAYPEAIDNLKRALGQSKGADSTQTKDALFALGEAYLAADDMQNASSTFSRFVDTYTRDERIPDALMQLAYAASRTKDHARSNDASTRLLKLNAPEPLRREALLRLARNAREAGQAASAVQHYTRYTELFPDAVNTPAVLFETARVIESDQRDLRRAGALYEVITTRHARSPFGDDAAMGAARCYEGLKEYSRSLELYRTFITMYPASDLRGDAEERIRMIEAFEAKDKDAGLEKLALLVGDVVQGQDRSGLARRLAEISFHQLKNYQAAAAQFGSAIEGGLQPADLVNAMFLRARALELLSWRSPEHRAPAIETYRAYLTRFPTDSRNQDALLSLFELSATSAASAQQAETLVLSIDPQTKHRPAMDLRTAALLENADSTAAALTLYAAITRQSPGDPAAEEAGFARMRLLLKAGLTDSAVAVGTPLLAAFPNGRHSAVIIANLGQLAQKRGQALRAVELLDRLIEEFPYTNAAAAAQGDLADACLASGNTARAIAMYTALLSNEGALPARGTAPDPDILLALGKALAQGGDVRGAKPRLFSLLAREQKGPRAAEALTTLGMIYRNEGSTDLATSYFRQASAASPATATSREIADILFDSGEYTDALRQYTALAAAGKDKNEQRGLAARIVVTNLRLNAFNPADRDIAAFRAAYPDNDTEMAEFELERGNAFFRQKDYVRALKSFQNVTSSYEETPSAPTAMFWIGKVHEATNKPQEALTQFEKLMKEHPDAPIMQKVHFALGNIQYQAEKWDEAIRNYRMVTDNPNADPALLPYAINNLIETYEIAGIFDAALTLTRRYLELYPNADDAFDKRIKIGILYQRLGYYDQSVLHLQTLLEEAGSDLEGEIRYYIGEANFGKGDYQQAILDFLKVPYLVTKKGKVDWTATSLYMSGQAYEKMGRSDQALTMYKQIIDRPGIDETFKAAARKEIDRVHAVLKKTK